MMGFLSGANPVRSWTTGTAATTRVESDSEEDDLQTELDENEGSIILSMISQLRVGMDLSRVTFPTFVLEPRSMLERITDFMARPDLIFGAEKCNDPEERFIQVLQYYLAGWHIKPKGVKKPYNPVLGEFYRCKYTYKNNTEGYYIAEQVSHHPPISAYFYISPSNGVMIVGELRPKSRFLGNSVMTAMEGENRVTLLGIDDGEYVITMPNMYGRGILFGKMFLELGDKCDAKNVKNDIVCDLEFKTKGYFSGTYNAIYGKIRRGTTDTGEINGKWTSSMSYTNTRTNHKRTLFNAKTDGQNIAPKSVPPLSKQEPLESRRLWGALTKAIEDKDMEAATTSKSAIEDAQREKARKMEEAGKKHVPRFFEQNKQGQWVPKLKIPTDPRRANEAVQKWIFDSPPPA